MPCSNWADAQADQSSLGARAILLVFSWDDSVSRDTWNCRYIELFKWKCPLYAWYRLFIQQNFWNSKRYWLLRSIVPEHDKTNKMTSAPSEVSDQPGHPPSLIRVFAVRMKKPWVLSYLMSAQRRLGRCPDDLNLCWVYRLFCWFCHVAAQLVSCWFESHLDFLWESHILLGWFPRKLPAFSPIQLKMSDKILTAMKPKKRLIICTPRPLPPPQHTMHVAGKTSQWDGSRNP